MPYIHSSIKRLETPQLLREYRSTIIHIAALDYDLKLHIYLGHPKKVKEAIADEMTEYINYANVLSKELESRGI